MARIKTTRTVKVALWALRIYLLVLLTLIGIKFARVFSAQKVDGAAALMTTTNRPTDGTVPKQPRNLNNSSDGFK